MRGDCLLDGAVAQNLLMAVMAPRINVPMSHEHVSIDGTFPQALGGPQVFPAQFQSR